MNSTSQKRVIILLAIAIGICTLALIGAQVSWIRATAKTEQENFLHDIQLSLQKVVNEIDKQESGMLLKQGMAPRAFQSDEQRMHMQAVIKQLSVGSNPIEKRISMQQVDTLLRNCFHAVGIFSRYDFAVTDDRGTIIFSTTGFEQAEPERSYVIMLFPNEPDNYMHYFLNVYIPYSRGYIIHAMRWMILVSTVLIFITIATFAATLIIIFRQKRLSKLKSDFVNNVTHELKTPITTIMLAAQMLQDPTIPSSPESIDRLAKMIRSESQQLLQLVESVLRSAIADNAHLRLSIKDIEMHELIKKVVARFALQFNTLDASCELQLHAAHTHVMGDELHLANVLSNLVDNAIKYRKTEKILHVIVKTENKNNHLVLSVIDNGMGLAGHNIKHLFDQFYRKPVENMHTVKGFGLGLYYAKNIIESLNGRLQAASNADDNGSTFSVELPIYHQID